MQKVMVIGCPGSGKSTFSRRLHRMTQLPLYHLDQLFWNADRTTVERAVFLERLQQVLDEPRWIIDGNYSNTMELRLEWCDTVFFLDLDTESCLRGVRERMGQPRSDMPWIEREEDTEFLDFIQKFPIHDRPYILELLEKYAHKTIYIFRNRREIEEYFSCDPMA